MSYWRQRRVTEMHKKVAKQEYVEIPIEIIELEEEITKIKGKLAALRTREVPEVELTRVAAELTPLEYRYRNLLISFKLEK